ncbi:hypothetical protein SpCBS45565_g01144 [Spizellomyces sp. 'palustris']|nr:hypothetical protein SpCBS45565_g01144 [Spizellomyces sp. 'palustris']
MWVFGYGSLVWKVDFPYDKRIPGYVRGYVRRFWQGSTDHRGTPSTPGRVVTLIPYEEWLHTYGMADPHKHSPTDCCWGVAYKIPDEKIESVKAHLDHREKNGYQIFTSDVYHPDGGKDAEGNDLPVVKDAMVYVATGDNESFLGPVDLELMAKQIAETKGPSGWNADYLLGLCHSMRILAPHAPDPHLIELERAVLDALEASRHSSANSQPVLPHGSIREQDLEHLRALLDVDIKALLMGEKAANKAASLAHEAQDGVGRFSACTPSVDGQNIMLTVTAEARTVTDQTGHVNETVDTCVSFVDQHGRTRDLARSVVIIDESDR